MAEIRFFKIRDIDKRLTIPYNKIELTFYGQRRTFYFCVSDFNLTTRREDDE